MELRFRTATRADNAFFREMEFETTWFSLSSADQARLSEKKVRRALDDTHEVLLARPGNRVVIAETPEGDPVGLLWYGVSRNLISGEDEAWIYNLSVLPAFRRQGIGRRLLDHAETLARQDGHAVLGLMVSQHNVGARQLYEELGFETTNLVMRRVLQPGASETR